MSWIPSGIRIRKKKQCGSETLCGTIVFNVQGFAALLRIRTIYFFLRIRLLGSVSDFQDPDPNHFTAIVNNPILHNFSGKGFH